MIVRPGLDPESALYLDVVICLFLSLLRFVWKEMSHDQKVSVTPSGTWRVIIGYQKGECYSEWQLEGRAWKNFSFCLRK